MVHATNTFTYSSWQSTMLKDSSKNFVKLFPQKIIIIQLYSFNISLRRKLIPCQILIEIDRSLPRETIEDITIVLYKINYKMVFYKILFLLEHGS